MTCDVYGTEINRLNENTEKVNEVSRTHIPLNPFTASASSWGSHKNDCIENCNFLSRANIALTVS